MAGSGGGSGGDEEGMGGGRRCKISSVIRLYYAGYGKAPCIILMCISRSQHVRRLGMLELGRTDTGELFAPSSVTLSAMFCMLKEWP